jgi:hypothetical protein
VSGNSAILHSDDSLLTIFAMGSQPKARRRRRAAFEDSKAGRRGTIPAQHLPHSDVGAAASSQGFLT